jgi:hypothetical protein
MLVSRVVAFARSLGDSETVGEGEGSGGGEGWLESWSRSGGCCCASLRLVVRTGVVVVCLSAAI